MEDRVNSKEELLDYCKDVSKGYFDLMEILLTSYDQHNYGDNFKIISYVDTDKNKIYDPVLCEKIAKVILEHYS